MKMRFVAAVAVVLASVALPLAVPLGAEAQAVAPAGVATPYPVPTLAPGTNVDPTARTIINTLGGLLGGNISRALNSNVGTVTYFKGYAMEIEVGQNRYENVHLFRGTTIDPRGETIRIGDTVDIGGRKEADGSLDANAITIRH